MTLRIYINIFGNRYPRAYIFIQNKEVVSLLLMKTGEVITKHNIQMPEIKTTGVYTISIKIYSNISSNLQLQVVPLLT